MAVTLLELRGLFNDADLLNKVESAVCVSAVAVAGEATPDQLRVDWAQAALGNTHAAAKVMLKALLGQNQGAADLATITGADDTTIMTQVANMVDLVSGIPTP